MADKKTLSPEEKKLAAEKHVDELVQKALVALEEMRKLDQEQVDYIIEKVHQVVEHYRKISPFWDELEKGEREHVI